MIVQVDIKKPVFSLVMPCYKCEDFIKKAIDSIIDQDLENWELICVVNGDWDKKDETIEIIRKYKKKDSRIQLIDIDKGNACTARNFGASMSKGKYISFFSSDFYMYPGCLRKWKKEFEEHPEADFVYGGYRLMLNGEIMQQVVPSKPFDVWELEMEPYIDGGFPMKREVWQRVEWDGKVKSLNDWDFWIRVAHAGFKGYFFLDITYAAEMPRKGGLSHDSADNWLERVNFIKKKNNIPKRDICVVSLGAQPHGKRIAKILDADFKVAPQAKPHEYKMIYLMGFYVGTGESAVAHSNVFEGVAHTAKRVIHWIGTDVLQLKSASYKVCYNDLKVLIGSLNNCTNLSEFEPTKSELETVDIESEIVALPIGQEHKIRELPKKFTVAVYTPNNVNAKWIYNLDMVKDIVKSCPHINFLFFGGGLRDFKAKNLENVGWTDMDKIIDKSSCLMRLTYHDGLPVTPIEFAMAGRDAVTTIKLPFMRFAGTGIYTKDNYAVKKEEIVKLLKQIKKDQSNKKEHSKIVKKARKFYKELTSPDVFRKRIYGILNEKKSKAKHSRTSI